MDSLTDRQREVLSAIRSLTSKLGYGPSIRELGKALDIRSTNGVKDHLKYIAAKGFIVWDRGVARSLRLTADAEEALGEPDDELGVAARQAHEALDLALLMERGWRDSVKTARNTLGVALRRAGIR